jgi:hypothetical protein
MTARSLNVTPELRASLTARAEKNGTTFPVELRKVITAYAKGTPVVDRRPASPSKVNIAVDDEVWNKALLRASIEGTKLSTAINSTVKRKA